jgi:diguanylate cyclase (GGDEF)-like protein
MALIKPTESHSEDLDSTASEAVVNISKYQNADEKSNSESSAFDQVMSQMNIADRPAFDVKYDQYWKSASENGELLSVLICEIDYFKDYVDNYGHQGASFMLLVIGLALKNTCEKYGCYLAHYRGNEFAILIKGGDVTEVEEIGEALRLAVEEARTEHKHSKVSDVVTLSIGISSVYPTSLSMLIQNSQNALHSAQKAGFNRVCSNIELKNESFAAVSESVNPAPSAQPEVSEFSRLMSDMNIVSRSDFNGHFINVWQSAMADSDFLSMIVCEIDFFADYREHHGQQSSEDILLIVASTLQNKCEEFNTSIVYLGGDKFTALIKGGNATMGLKAAKLLQSSVHDLEIENTFSPVRNSLSLSLGLSNIFPSDKNTMKGLMNSAVAALNNAKSDGYDQVSVG